MTGRHRTGPGGRVRHPAIEHQDPVSVVRGGVRGGGGAADRAGAGSAADLHRHRAVSAG